MARCSDDHPRQGREHCRSRHSCPCRPRSGAAGAGVPDVDASALLLTEAGKVRDDADFVFYNQPAHASGAVTYDGKQGGGTPAATDTLSVDLGRLQPDIERVVIAASSDGGTFGQVPGLNLRLLDADDRRGDRPVRRHAGVHGDGVRGRRACTSAAGPGSSAPSGRAGLPGSPAWPATSASASTTNPPPRPPTPTPAAAPAPAGGGVSLSKAEKLVRLEKNLENRGDTKLLSLTKKAAVSLEKRGLATHTARVAIALDISASMHKLYGEGKIQALAERVLALGMRFDDNASIDCFLFGADAYEAGEITLDNYKDYVPAMLRKHRLEGGTYYGKAMAMMRRHYFGSDAPRSSPLADMPVYVMFVTDGATMDERVTREQLTYASFEPMFFQFMAIGESSHAVDATPGAPVKKQRGLAKLAQAARDRAFALLEDLDDMTGRYVDNADFFAVSDPANISDDALFDLLMNEYPGWLTMARDKGLTR